MTGKQKIPNAFEFTLNGKLVRVEAVSPNTTRLEFLGEIIYAVNARLMSCFSRSP